MKLTTSAAQLVIVILLLSCSKRRKVHDLEGYNYKTIKIGNTEWFAENLQTA